MLEILYMYVNQKHRKKCIIWKNKSKWKNENGKRVVKQPNGTIKTKDRNGKLTPQHLKLAIQKLTRLFVVWFMQFDAVLSIAMEHCILRRYNNIKYNIYTVYTVNIHYESF